MIHVMLPVQYLRAANADLAKPQRRLMMAVLQAALDDCQGTASAAGASIGRDPRASRQAISYFQSRDRTWPYSFDNICDAIGLDAEGLRRTICGRFATGD